MDRKRLFKLLETIVKPVSLATVASLLGLVLARWLFDWSAPAWLWRYPVPILTGGAVGYLTNYVAIQMLFRPYSEADGHWLRFMPFWKLGLISANKAEIGRAMGEQIPKKLLNADEISDELCDMAEEVLGDRDLLAKARRKLDRFLHRHGDRIAAFLVPYFEDEIRQAVHDKLKPEELRALWNEFVANWLDEAENRELIARALVTILRERFPELLEVFKREAALFAKEYARGKFGRLLNLLGAGNAMERLVEKLDWQEIGRHIEGKLADPTTVVNLGEELSLVTARLADWLESPAGETHVDGFIRDGKAKLDAFLHDYIKTKLPVMADQVFRSGVLWQLLEERILPGVRKSVRAYLRREGKDLILSKLNLSRRIEESVERQDVETFHGMIDTMAAEHLGAIQVLGYILGAVAGVLLAFGGVG